MEKEQFEELLLKIDGMSDRIRLISERQNSQYTDIMMLLKQKIKSREMGVRDMKNYTKRSI